MEEQVLTKYEVMSVMKYKSVSGFYTFCKRTPEFPKSFPLGLRRVGWLKQEVDAYLLKKMNERHTVEV